MIRGNKVRREQMVAPNLTGQTAASLRTAAFQKWEDLGNEPAAVGTPENIMLEVIAFLSGLQNGSIQRSAEGGLINFALGERLDEIGVLFGLSRRLNETDDDYRLRVMSAPSAFTTAGTKEQIETIVKRVDPSITDVAVILTVAPSVSVKFITKTGLPSAGLIATVLAALTDPKVKPTLVVFTVEAPTIINFQIAATITTYSTADINTIKERCAAALNTYIQSVGSSMGKDVVVKQIIGALQAVSGVYEANLTLPASNLIIASTDWATAPQVLPDDIILLSSVVG
jgi:uncharacterized phage protein gp47/JayE